KKNRLLLELLVPIAKTYPTEKGREAVDNGLQVLGGYGYCSDFVLQQYLRDIRIMAIYEGTTGIQSLDLLGRKATMDNGKAVQLLAEEMQRTIEQATTFDELKPYARQLADKMGLSQKVLKFLLSFAAKGEYERFLADATVFMDFFSTLVLGWLWLDMAAVAKRELVSGNTAYTPDFYESKIHAMRFFFKYELPKMEGLAPTLMSEEVLTILEEKEVIA
ncbi:MAG: acyl-CoA dehydrogenase, partial [Phaeodactylibacter sp.]|nr:acyl-CoA dehydrogenase [Phaeodactylibacter sp.]